MPHERHKQGPFNVDLDDDDEDRPARYSHGDIGRILKPGFIELIEHRASPEQREHLMGFLNWVPPTVLEDYLVLALEYGADKVMPKRPSRNGSKRRTQRPASPV